MEYTTLEDLVIPQIAVGTWSWGRGLLGSRQIFGSRFGETDLRPVFDRAVATGFTLWDTAPVYGMGTAEDLLGRLSQTQDNLLLSTKFFPLPLFPEVAMAHSLQKSLTRLHAKQADLFWIHTPQNVEKWTSCLIPLMEQGKLRCAGVSNHSLAEIQSADTILRSAGFRLAAVQNHYSLLYHGEEEERTLDWCHRHDVTFFSYLVLEQGALTGHYTKTHPMPKHSRRGRAYPPSVLSHLSPLLRLLTKIGADHGGTAAEIAIAWAIEKGTVPIVGMTKPHHVVSCDHAASICLSPSEMAQLEQESLRSGVRIPTFWAN
jgi:aryl-alcohol dehydrogenase-like predicted oxidoreductase